MSLQSTFFDETEQPQQFSVAIMPPENIIQEIRLLKKKLQDTIGWYHSCNSDAHITFNVFKCNQASLTNWVEYLKDFTRHLSLLPLRFNTTGTFSNGAVVILPDDTTGNFLIPVMRSFHTNSPRNHFGKSVNPHISIGRKLSEGHIEIAKQLISPIEIAFNCDNLALRKLNNEKCQYDVYQRFYFGNYTNAVGH